MMNRYRDSLSATIARGRALIDSHRVVFFDAFDTLIVRDCKSPSDVFDYVQTIDDRWFGDKEPHKFKSDRIEAELSCYRAGLIPDLDQIYDRLPFDAELKARLKRLETESELQLIAKNYVGAALYDYAVKEKKAIAVVSDMYLSNGIIRRMLEKCGYNFDTIIVSNEYGCDKKSGKLFEKAIEAMHADRKEVVHFGDNPVSDMRGAKRVGIECMAVPRTDHLLSYFRIKGNENLIDRCLSAFVANRIQFMDDGVSALGYEVCGAMVVGFCQWLHRKIIEEKYDCVLFCARDVCQTLEIYQRMYPEHEGLVHYLYVSLKSLKAPYKALTGEDTSDYAKEQLRLIRRYLDQIGCKGKVAIVDSGYGGHTQGMLTAIAGDRCELHGLYMRISKNFPKNVADRESYPYMFQDKPEVKSYICGAFFETMLSATHGRTNGYAENNEGMIVPVLGDDNPCKDLLSRFQAGIDEFARQWSASPFSDMEIPGQTVQNAFLQFAFYPEKADVETLASVTGGNESYGSIVIRREKGYYLRHAKSFFSDLHETYWKGGFMYSCFKSFYPVVCRAYLALDCFILNRTGF